MTICCAEVGSVAKGSFGWASISTDPHAERRSGGDIAALSGFVAEELECPLSVPITDEPSDLTRARNGEGNRAWSASGGANALALLSKPCVVIRSD